MKCLSLSSEGEDCVNEEEGSLDDAQASLHHASVFVGSFRSNAVEVADVQYSNDDEQGGSNDAVEQILRGAQIICIF